MLTRTEKRVLMSFDSGRWQVHLLVFGYLCCHVLACTPPLVMSDWNVGWERWSNHLKGFNSLPHHLSVASVGPPPLYWLTHINRTYIIIFMRVMDHLRRFVTFGSVSDFYPLAVLGFFSWSVSDFYSWCVLELLLPLDVIEASPLASALTYYPLCAS